MPSIPGFAFSTAPKKPFGPRKIASYYNKLMTKVLNYKNYMAQEVIGEGQYRLG